MTARAVPLSPGHRPEHTLLYQLVEQHYPAFRGCAASTAMPGRAALLADEVLPERPLRQWVLSPP